MMHLKIRHTA